MDYAVPQGYGPLRQQIANRYVNLGARVEMEEVIITSGAMEAISLALRTITSPGDLVMVETPSYQGILQTIASLGLRIVDFPQVEAGGLDVEQLEAILSTQPVRAAVVVANFSNPSGRTLNDTAKQSLVSICRRYGTVIVEDDVYGELAWDDSRPSPLRRFDQGDNVITCSSFSKFLAPGLRVGWLLGGARIDELVRVKHFSTIGNPALPQLAISNYLERHKLERGLRKLRRGLAQTARQMRDVIIHGWPQGSRVSQPQGGLSLWIKLPRGADAEKLFGSALSHGIGIAPGSIFSNGDDYADHSQLDKRRSILRSLIGKTGENFLIEAPFHCDYGFNISLGENFYANVNLVILDCTKVTIGNNVFIAPNVHICCAGHPLDAERRNKGLEYAFPVTIEDDVWIGVGAQILPGVTVGRGSVVAAGAIVTKDVPPMTLVGGNPARVIREITEADALKYREA